MSEVGGWARRAEGIVREVVGPKARRGLDLLIDADLPAGSGLASSAASMAALGAAAARALGLELETMAYALTLQRAEQRYNLDDSRFEGGAVDFWQAEEEFPIGVFLLPQGRLFGQVDGLAAALRFVLRRAGLDA